MLEIDFIFRQIHQEELHCSQSEIYVCILNARRFMRSLTLEGYLKSSK